MDKSAMRARRTRAVLETNQALEVIYELLGADRNSHFEFTSGGAEAVAQVLYNLSLSQPHRRVRIAATPCAEAPVQLTIGRIAERVEIPLDCEGRVTREALEKILEEGVDLVSLSWANGLTGVVQPIEELAPLCFEKGVPLHVDITHALGRLFFRLRDLPIDYVTFDGPLLGAGGVLIKERAEFKPLILGKAPPDPSQSKKLADSFRERYAEFDPINLEISRLRTLFEEQCTCGRPLFQAAQRLPHISIMAFPGVASETLQFVLEEKGIEASLGGGTFPKLSHVLKHCGVDPSLQHTALSFQFSLETTSEEIARVVAGICEAYPSLEKMTPIGAEK